MRDTSSQQKTDSAPWEQAERLKCIIDGTNIGTWEWNVQTGETTFNERWAEIIGYRLEELAPVDINTWLNHAHPDDLRESGVRLERHFSGETPFYDYQCRMRHKSGRWVWVHDRGRVVSWTDEGKPLMMYGTHADITEMREQQDEAHRTSAQLQAILDSATGVSVIAINPDGLITLFNRGAQRLLGYQAEEVVGLQTPALIHLGDEVTQRGRELSQLVGREISGFEVFVHLARQGEPETRQWTYVHKDGTRRRVNLTISAIFDRQGTLSGFLGIASDISEMESTTRALQESENRFRGLVANLPGVVYRCENDANWTMRYMSDEVASLTGFPASDFIDSRVRAFSSVVHPDDLHITYQSVAAIERHEKFELTYRLKHVDGHSVWVREQGRGEYGANGELLWVSGFIWDISDRKAAEDALRVSERRFSGAFNTAPQGMAIVDLDGRWMEVNDALCRMLGYSSEELLQLDFQHITHPDDLTKDLALLQQLLEGVIADYQLEKRYIDKRGNVLWILLSVSLVRDALGVPLHFVSQIQDITDRFEAEKRLREREEYLSTLLDNVIDAIVTIDESGLIETFNPAAERIFGYAKADVAGQNVELLIPEHYRDQHDEFLLAYRESGVPRILGKDLELPAQRRNGELFTMELAVSQITLQSQRRFIAVIRDISERKRIERMKNEFVSTVSHELRTPLTSIAGALGLINGGALGEVPAQMGEMLRIAQSNSQRLSGLINDLLDMDKLVAGKMTLNLHRLKLWPLLATAVEQNQPYATQHSVNLHLKPPPLDVEVRVDRQRFDQVMANLLSNAAKFSAPGADVEVSAALAVTRVRISVRDFGMGIPEAFRARIFGKFSQADATDTRQKGGTGLGLAITKELIERMAGAIGFESVEGQGTVFWVELPVEQHP
ncbi:PAS domain S-box protein [Pseudomonas sp. o96-267]|uniref:PAS domain-containing sensor histidine kinase n=1 Tax=Pseudomonas sp. o96-267 TaxID=2479853 RepID=UPI000F7966A4|nr:PAS domain S-box protein [Pseudomonas sp. o96-267]RRV42629.1 PAS domain S-box protein [Pseudomonas sp. o96-267]